MPEKEPAPAPAAATPAVSRVLASLPLRDVFAAPLVAAIEAHNTACSTLQQFIDKAGRNKDGSVSTVQFRFSQNDSSGAQSQRTIELPLIAVLPLPSFGVDRLTVDFDVRIDAGESDTSGQSKELGGDLSLGYGPVSLKLKGSLSNKSEQTRKTDTSARYTVRMEASRQPMPEAFNRVVDALVGEIVPKPALPAPAPSPAPASTPDKPNG